MKHKIAFDYDMEKMCGAHELKSILICHIVTATLPCNFYVCEKLSKMASLYRLVTLNSIENVSCSIFVFWPLNSVIPAD